MARYLLMAEKPSAEREYKAVYLKHKDEIDAKIGGEIEFMSLRGHIFRNLQPKEYDIWDKKWVDLYNEDLPMVPSTWKIAPIKGAEDVVSTIKNNLKTGFDGIIVATDSDVEGYGIYYMVSTALNLSKYKTLRFYEVSLTEKDILNSFLTMEDLYTTPRHKNALNAYIFRSRWDWLIGMNFTTGYSVRFGELYKYGSVKAPTLKLIYDNCMLIDNFKEVKTYGVKSTHKEEFQSVLLNDSDNKERSFQNKADADALVATLANTATVTSYEVKKEYKKPPKLYALSDLQVDAAKAPYGYTPDKTLEIAQSLYETRKILTYPRTTGNYLSSAKAADIPGILSSVSSVPEISKFVSKITPADMTKVSSNKDVFNDAEVAKAAHDALIPTGAPVNWAALTKEEQDIFLLVCKRLIAHYMPYFCEEKTTMMLDNNGNRFKASGRRTIENGFYDLYSKTTADVILPVHSKGDIVEVTKSESYEKVSQPPARYTAGTIIGAMKNIASQVTDPELKKTLKDSEGIGTEATRANIISDLQSSGYIEMRTKSNVIYITDLGKKYIESIRNPIDDGFDYGIADPMQVAYWSSKTKKIQLGECNGKDVYEEFLTYLNEKIADIKSSGDPIKRNFASKNSGPNLICPLCGGKVINGKFGFFCSNNKEKGCGLSIPLEMASKKLTDKQRLNLLEGKKIHAKGFKSKTGKDFEADVYLNKETGKLAFDFGN